MTPAQIALLIGFFIFGAAIAALVTYFAIKTTCKDCDDCDDCDDFEVCQGRTYCYCDKGFRGENCDQVDPLIQPGTKLTIQYNGKYLTALDNFNLSWGDTPVEWEYDDDKKLYMRLSGSSIRAIGDRAGIAATSLSDALALDVRESSIWWGDEYCFDPQSRGIQTWPGQFHCQRLVITEE